jgi:hypothetical protein
MHCRWRNNRGISEIQEAAAENRRCNSPGMSRVRLLPGITDPDFLVNRADVRDVG